MEFQNKKMKFQKKPSGSSPWGDKFYNRAQYITKDDERGGIVFILENLNFCF